MRSVHSRAPSGLIGCVRSIPVRPRVCRGRSGPFVHYRAPWGSSHSFGCVRSIPVRLSGRRFCSGAFAPFPYALGVVRVYSVPVCLGDPSVRSIHSRAPWVSSRSLGCVLSIPGGRLVLSGAFSPFPCALGVVGCVGPFLCVLRVV